MWVLVFFLNFNMGVFVKGNIYEVQNKYYNTNTALCESQSDRPSSLMLIVLINWQLIIIIDIFWIFYFISYSFLFKLFLELHNVILVFLVIFFLSVVFSFISVN